MVNAPFVDPGFSGPGMGALFAIVPLLVMAGFVFVIGSMIYRWAVNQASPVQVVDAKVVAKREYHSHSGGAGEMHHHHSSTSYYITFELDSGERVELPVGGSDYGLLVEGDRGILNYQGTQFNGFQRDGLVR